LQLEECSHLALDHLPFGLLVINRDRVICIFNQALSKILGIKTETVLGRPLLGNLDNREPELNLLVQTLLTGKEFHDLKPQAVLTVSCPETYLVNTYPLRNRTGIMIGAMAVFLLADRLQKMENAVIKAEKLSIIGQLAAGMVHELRNQLTSVCGLLQLLQRQPKGAFREEYIALMLDQLNHANRLITEFLQFSKPGYSKPEKCSIVNSIKDMLILLENEVISHQISIEVALNEQIPSVYIDSAQLKQVFINIMKNSIDALSPGGKIFIQASWNEEERTVQVSFRDTGVGIDPETIKKMFNPFFTTKESGIGLGMFISKKIIENHGGRIEIQSKKGEGTTVVVILPVAP